MNSIEDTLVRHVDEGSAIGSFEWMEIDTLSSEIATLEARVADARSLQDHRLVEIHKQEIAALRQRHARLLDHITTSLAASAGSSPHLAMDTASRVSRPYANTNGGVTAVWDRLTPTDSRRTETTSLVGSAGSSPNLESAEGDDPRQPHGLPEEDRESVGGPGQQSAEVFELTTASRVAMPTTEGVIAVWDQLTPADIERATHELDTRRTEMLARHQKEIQGLNAEQSEVDTLAQAIEAFARKFNFLKSAPSVTAASSVG